MAKLLMKDYTASIMIEPPKNGWGLQTVIIGGADLYPGHPVTQTAETPPTVASPASANDVFYGILLDKIGKGIDEVFTAGESATVMLNGSGGACWTWLIAADATVFPGTRLHMAAGVYCTIAETMLFENVGLIIEYSLTDASDDRPVKVVLCG